MKREIKFRAWVSDTKVMVQWETISQNYKHGICSLHDYIDTDNEILMQYTGVKDKNDKEIYEGDIVRNCSRTWQEEDNKEPTINGAISSIVYRGNGFWVDAESFGWEGESLWNWDEMEIIGNIYEHPQLLN